MLDVLRINGVEYKKFCFIPGEGEGERDEVNDTQVLHGNESLLFSKFKNRKIKYNTFSTVYVRAEVIRQVMDDYMNKEFHHLKHWCSLLQASQILTLVEDITIAFTVPHRKYTQTFQGIAMRLTIDIWPPSHTLAGVL